MTTNNEPSGATNTNAPLGNYVLKAYELAKRWLIVLRGGGERASKRIGPFNSKSDAEVYASERFDEDEWKVVGMVDVEIFEREMHDTIAARDEQRRYEAALRSVPSESAE